MLQSTAPITFPAGEARALRVFSGVHRLPVSGSWSPVSLRVEYRLMQEPQPGIEYTVEIDADAVIDSLGRKVEVPPPRTFRLADAPGTWNREEAPPPDFADEIEPLLARCVPCHAQHDGQAFTRESLVLRRAASDERRYLVEPGEPAASVLLLRMLDAYTPEGRLMPPYWSDVPPLSEPERRLVERWILAGAP